MKTTIGLLLGLAIGFFCLHPLKTQNEAAPGPGVWAIGDDEVVALRLPQVLGGENGRSDLVFPITMINRLTSPVKIVDLQPSCGCMAANIDLPLVLKENQGAEFELRISFAKTAVGKIEQSLVLKAADGRLRRLQIRGLRLSDEGLLPFPPALDLGSSVAGQGRDIEVVGTPAALLALSASGERLALLWQGGLEELQSDQLAGFGLKRKRLRVSRGPSEEELAGGRGHEESEISWLSAGRKMGRTQVFWSNMTSSIVTREVMLGRINGRRPVKLDAPALLVEKYHYVPHGEFSVTPVGDGLKLALSNPKPGLVTGTVDLIEKSSGGKVGVISWSGFVDPAFETQD